MDEEMSEARCRNCEWTKRLEDPHDLEAYIRVHMVENAGHSVVLRLPDGQFHLFDDFGLHVVTPPRLQCIAKSGPRRKGGS